MKTSYSESKSPHYKTRGAKNKKKGSNMIAPDNPQIEVESDILGKGTKTHEDNKSDDDDYLPKGISDVNPSNNERNEEDDANEEYIHPIFLQEPFHLKNMTIDDNHIKKLKGVKGDKFLSNELVDFLIKNGIPSWKPIDFLVTSTNVESLLDFYNEKAESTNESDIGFLQKAREEFKFFKTRQFRIVSLCFEKGHYFIIFMILDANDVDGDYFQYLTIYDSLKRSVRNVEQNGPTNNAASVKPVVHNSSAIRVLKKYQQFFLNYILYNSKHKYLLKDPVFILKGISYGETPVMEKGCDCSLFGYAVLLHLACGLRIKKDLFTQKDISYLRLSLYIILNATTNDVGANPKEFIPYEFLVSFFKNTYTTYEEPNLFLDYLHAHNRLYESPKKKLNPATDTDNNNEAQDNDNRNENNEDNDIIEEGDSPITPFVDNHFVNFLLMKETILKI